MRHGSLFSGIGGFDLAAEWMGWENVFHCEWNEFGQRVLKHYWPNAESFTDITKTDFKKYANKIDILTRGFPCQPYSSAGKRLGKEDERHLWPEMLRAIREISPSFIVGENVRGLTNWSGGLVFDEVCTELENLGYQVAPVIIPACGVGAPHRRERVWFVAYNNSIIWREGREFKPIEQSRYRESNEKSNTETNGVATDTGQSANELQRKGRLDLDGVVLEKRKRQKKTNRFNSNNSKNAWHDFPTQSPICGGDDGLPTELDGVTFSKWRAESIKAYGNAIVPQVAYQIFKAL